MRGNMRSLLLASVVVATGIVAAAQMRRSGLPAPARDVIVTPARVDRFARWLKAADEHEPGAADDALEAVAAWSPQDLREVWADAKFLAALMRNLKLSRSSIDEPRGSVSIVYSPLLLQRMRAMACAAIGRLASPDCVILHATDTLDDELRRVGEHAAADRNRTGEDNYILRRGALLHTDVEILEPSTPAEPPQSAPALPG